MGDRVHKYWVQTKGSAAIDLGNVGEGMLVKAELQKGDLGSGGWGYGSAKNPLEVASPSSARNVEKDRKKNGIEGDPRQ